MVPVSKRIKRMSAAWGETQTPRYGGPGPRGGSACLSDGTNSAITSPQHRGHPVRVYVSASVWLHPPSCRMSSSEEGERRLAREMGSETDCSGARGDFRATGRSSCTFSGLMGEEFHRGKASSLE
jgi:hypothetical protein